MITKKEAIMEGMRAKQGKVHLRKASVVGQWLIAFCGYRNYRGNIDLYDIWGANLFKSELICKNCLRIYQARKEAHG